MSPLLNAPLRLVSPFKVMRGAPLLPFDDAGYSLSRKYGVKEQHGNHEHNAYLSRLGAFKKDLLDDPPL